MYSSFFVLALAGVYLLSLLFSPDYSAKATSSLNKNPIISEMEIGTGQYQYDKEKTAEEDVPAAADSKAKGKITEKTLDDSGANLKYGKIYIKNNTSKSVDIKKELLVGVKIKPKKDGNPQVLIVHTHTTECYMTEKRNYYTDKDQTRTTDNSKNIVAVGEVLKKGLEDKGFGVIHATEKHDYPEYSGSYQRAEDTIKKYLKKYPSIKVVIDLHRDSVSDGKAKTALTTKIKGKSAAQVMIVSGCADGSVENFDNWRENFRLAIRLQQSMEVMYPTLARPILFTARRYNQHLTTGSLLIECGTEANTLEEAKYSAQLLADSIAITLENL